MSRLINTGVLSQRFGKAFLLHNLVAFYKFQSNANDSHYNAHNGTATGSPTFITGVEGNGINFPNDGTARYVTIADSDNFSFTNGSNDLPFSISMWVKFHAFSSTGNWLINKRGGTTQTEWQLNYRSSSSQLSLLKFSEGGNTSTQGILSSANPFSTDTWYHIACTDDGSGTEAGMKLYINGSLDVEGSVSSGSYLKMNNGNNVMVIGAQSWSPTVDSGKHRGMIDELGIWKNRELTAEEVAFIYNEGAGRFYPF
jgi:hypothetical protein